MRTASNFCARRASPGHSVSSNSVWSSVQSKRPASSTRVTPVRKPGPSGRTVNPLWSRMAGIASTGSRASKWKVWRFSGTIGTRMPTIAHTSGAQQLAALTSASQGSRAPLASTATVTRPRACSTPVRRSFR